LTMDEIQKLRKLCPRFVNIATPPPDLTGMPGHPGLEKLPIDDMFRRFYQKNHGATPDESLVRLFMELATPSEPVREWTVPDLTPDEPLYQ
jgi:exonuclease SbcD